MIVNDHQPAAFAAASALTLGILLTLSGAASADAPPIAAPVTSTIDSAAAATSTASVSLVAAGRETPYTTSSKTVGEFLKERGIEIADGDYVSSDRDATIVPGMRVVYRPVVPVVLYVGAQKRTLHTAADTVGDLLREQSVAPTALDEVSPTQSTRLLPNDVVRFVEVRTWTSKRREPIAPSVTQQFDPGLRSGSVRTIAAGAPGERETMIRFVRRNSGPLAQTVLASRIIREPRARVIARGIAAYASLAHVAQQGFASALHFAGSALQVIATAYTASCYGCSGITASGVRAGFGIVAVDPRVIPLGTRLFVPGYGRAIAGDTGGAIIGRRVDLGMDRVADALRFGRQPMTVYVLK